jgi:2-polyprenyl-6-methoxyphenol hydroxylase-like FAD-dependent oxidoreductase
MRTSHVPVLVVGAGPAGSLLTLELARRGVHVRTVDRSPRPRSGSNAFLLHARTLEVLARIDERLAARFLERGLRCKGYAMHAEGDAPRPAVDFTTLASPYPFLLVHRQSETELYVREYVSAHFGVAPDWGTRCVGVSEVDDGVVATLECDGVEERVHCQYLIGCDGAWSNVRGAVDVAAAAPPVGAVVDTVDAVLDGWPDDDEWVHYSAAGDDTLVVARLPGERWRIQWVHARAERAGDGAEASVAALRQVLATRFPRVRLESVVAHERWQRRLDASYAYRHGRVFLAGDAAHGHSIVSGLDLDCAVQDACNLGWKLAFVLKGLAAPELLASYEAERRPVAEAVRATAHELRAALERGGETPRSLAMRCAGLEVQYRDATAHVGEARFEGPLVGEWCPDISLERGRKLLAAERQRRFTLLAMAASDEGRKVLGASLAPLGTRFANVLAVRVVGPPAALDARYGASQVDSLWLVRPDGYLAYKARGSDLAALEGWLAERFAG